MQITDIKVRKIYEEGPMKAVVSVTFDDALALHDIKVISAREKTFITILLNSVLPEWVKDPDTSFPITI